MRTAPVPILLAPALTLLLILSAAGCGNVKEDKMAELLEVATSGYRQAIRWGYYPAAAGFLHPDERQNVDLDKLANVRVTGYEVVQPPVIGAEKTAVQVVQIDYVLNDEQVLKSIGDRQQWRYDEAQKTWWLHSGLPAFED
jgi:hypothetical protein